MANASRFASRLAADRFLGYLQAQAAAMMGERSVHTNRPELVAIHGYDTKFAMHALRLGVQGVELLQTGRITLPVPEPHRNYLRAVWRGEVGLAEVTAAVRDARPACCGSATTPACPTSPTAPGWTAGCTAAT